MTCNADTKAQQRVFVVGDAGIDHFFFEDSKHPIAFPSGAHLVHTVLRTVLGEYSDGQNSLQDDGKCVCLLKRSNGAGFASIPGRKAWIRKYKEADNKVVSRVYRYPPATEKVTFRLAVETNPLGELGAKNDESGILVAHHAGVDWGSTVPKTSVARSSPRLAEPSK